MVEGLNGLEKWLFNHSTICLFSDKIRRTFIGSAVHRFQGTRSINSSVRDRKKRKEKN
jgi:hypothetical protein